MTAPQLLKRASIRLLAQIAEHDHGQGVLFRQGKNGRQQLDGTDYAANRETFRVPSKYKLIAVEHPEFGVWKVRLTHAGRNYLDERETRRRGGRKAS
ncbi:hypothetical protein [Nonomuraea sp. B19D2]|uniref:hypothetical protein n=1 Tax=Nonomuraea sp. B19D2 TaxID=3159561 RepID=UPI0032DB1440